MKAHRSAPFLLPLLLAGLPACATGPEAEPPPHAGLCDASAAARLDNGHLLVGGDEDNVLRVYDPARGGAPLATYDLSAFLAEGGRTEEADIEDAARVGDRVYWITSHGANKNGKARPGRRRFFATDLQAGPENGPLRILPAGAPYTALVEDLAAHPPLVGDRLAEGARQAPEDDGGLNIEGLAARPQGGLWIGFRSPVTGGRALLVPLLNPADVVAGARPRLGEPARLDLGGLGVRGLLRREDGPGLWILAGSAGDQGIFRLYAWSGEAAGAPKEMAPGALKGLRPEALVADPARPGELLLISDDGGLRVEGLECKALDPSRRSFRTRWIRW